MEHKLTHDFPATQLGTVPIRKVSDARHHRKPWQLSVWIDGRRKRQFFSSREAAEKEWVNHRRITKKWGTLPYIWDGKAQAAYDNAIRKLGSREKLAEAVDFYLAHSSKDAPTLEDAVRQYLEAKAALGRSHRHQKDMRLRLEKLKEKFAPSQNIATIGRNELLAALLSFDAAPRSIGNYERGWHSFFRFWKKRGLLVENPLDGVDKTDLPKIQPSRKVILTVPQARGFMRTIATSYPHLIRWAAIQAFAGVRDAEAERMCVEFCDQKRRVLKIPAAICKTADDWLLHNIPRVMWDWFARDAGRAGPFPKPSSRVWLKIRQDLAKLTDPSEIISPWPYNGLRRSFCTYSMSLYGDAAQTAAWLRHRSPTRLYASYLGSLVSKAEARRYFGLTPEAVLAAHSSTHGA